MSVQEQTRDTSPSVLIAGLDETLCRWLRQRLPDHVEVFRVERAETVLEKVRERQWNLLLVEDRLPDLGLEQVLRAVRAIRSAQELHLVCVLNAGERRQLGRLIAGTGVQQLLFQPLDREELAHQLASLLSLRLGPAGPSTSTSAAAERASAAVAQLWARFRAPILDRVLVLEQALAALKANELTPDLCRKAEREAHKLAGSVGTFGFLESSKVARQVEQIFQDGVAAAESESERLGLLIPSLRTELDRIEVANGSKSEPDSAGPGESRAYLLMVDHDLTFAANLMREAALKGLHTVHVSTHAQARQAVAHERPQAVLLDLSFPNGKEQSLELLQELEHRDPPIPTLVLTENDVFEDRLAIARLGGEGALNRNQPPTQILEWVSLLLDRLKATQARVLAVDDDAQVLSTVRSLLEPRGVLLTSLDDPLTFWETLEETGPDLLILDVDMPQISGIELCRLVRSDPRWSSTPVLFLTAHTDPAMVQRIFSAGADDYVSKPIVGPELVTRITNRLERTQLYRTLAETDALTKVASRRKSIQVIRQFLKLSARHRQPFCLAIIDVDRFKQINDVHGHSLGDQVLQRFGQLLLQNFRSEDVVGRWGGDEFVVGMYGMKAEAARQRLLDLLEELKQQAFGEPGQPAFHVTFTAGIAEAPRHGKDLQHLYLASDRALYAQKAEGRGGVGVLSSISADEAIIASLTMPV